MPLLGTAAERRKGRVSLRAMGGSTTGRLVVALFVLGTGLRLGLGRDSSAEGCADTTSFPIAMPERWCYLWGSRCGTASWYAYGVLHETADATLFLGLLILDFADVEDAEPTNDKKSHFLGTESGTAVARMSKHSSSCRCLGGSACILRVAGGRSL